MVLLISQDIYLLWLKMQDLGKISPSMCAIMDRYIAAQLGGDRIALRLVAANSNHAGSYNITLFSETSLAPAQDLMC